MDSGIEARWLDGRDVLRKTVSSLLVIMIVAVVGAAGTIVWNEVSGGGLVRLLGGVTKKELQDATGPILIKETFSGLPQPDKNLSAYFAACPIDMSSVTGSCQWLNKNTSVKMPVEAGLSADKNTGGSWYYCKYDSSLVAPGDVRAQAICMEKSKIRLE